MTNSLTTEQLTLLIVQKYTVLMQLRDLARTQLEVIAADDTDRLLTLLAEKQPLLSELQRVERALDPFREQDPETRHWPQADLRRRCQVVAERANALLQELLELEQQASGDLSHLRDETAKQLQTASGAMAARQAYAVVPTLPTTGGLDLMSET